MQGCRVKRYIKQINNPEMFKKKNQKKNVKTHMYYVPIRQVRREK